MFTLNDRTRLLRCARRWCARYPCGTDPEDLLGDACLVLLSRVYGDRRDDKQPAPEGVANIGAFLDGTMRRLAKNYWRRWSAHELPLSPGTEIGGLPNHPLADSAAISVEDRRALAQGLRGLDEYSRAAVVEHACLDSSLAEVAHRHDRTVGSARMKYQRALKRLRSWLSPHFGNG